MKMRLLIAFVILFFLAPVVWTAEGKPTEEENKILALVLKKHYPNDGYTVVNPETDDKKGLLWGDNAKETKKYLLDRLQTNGVVLSGLLDRLLERNKESVRLTLKSSIKDGYLIDYDGEYENFFKTGGDGWQKWHTERPKADGMTTVSLPVYDQKAGLVLVYSGTQSDWEAGSGWLILYTYKNGQLKEINRVELWIS